MSKDSSDEFVRGIAWALAVSHGFNLSAGQMLSESGLTYSDFVLAGVVGPDLKTIRDLCKLEGELR